jgi:hypothetical protein
VSATVAKSCPRTAAPRFEYRYRPRCRSGSRAASFMKLRSGPATIRIQTEQHARQRANAGPKTSRHPRQARGVSAQFPRGDRSDRGACAARKIEPTSVSNEISRRSTESASSQPVRPLVTDPISKRVSASAAMNAKRVRVSVPVATTAVATLLVRGPTSAPSSAASSGSPYADFTRRI